MSKLLLPNEFAREFNAVRNRVSTLERAVRTLGPEERSSIGIPSGGTAGQSLVKKSLNNYETEWKTVTGGGEPKGVTPIKVVANEISIEEKGIINKYLAEESVEAKNLKIHLITEEKLAEALLGPAANKFGLRKLGTSALEALPGTGLAGGSAGQSLVRKGTEELEWKTISGKEYSAKAPIKLVGTEFELEEGKVSTKYLETHAVTEEKLEEALLGPAANKYGLRKLGTGSTEAAAGNEAVLKTGEQKIEGPCKFNPPGSPAGIILRNEAVSLKTQVKMIEAPLKLTFKEAGGTVASYAVQGEVTFEGAPEATNGLGQLFNNTIQFINVGNIAMGTISTVLAKPNFRPAAGSTTSAWGSVAVAHEPQLAKVTEGTAAASAIVGLVHGGNVAAGWTVAEHGAVHMKATTGAGTVTEEYGLKVENLTLGVSNYSVHSLGTGVPMRHAGKAKFGADESPTYVVDAAGDIAANKAGSGLRVKEGENAKMGSVALEAGTKTISNTSVTANSKIFLTNQKAGGTVGTMYEIEKLEAGVGFTIHSTNVLDTSTIAWLIFEPA